MQLQDIVFEVRKTLDETETSLNELNNGAGTWDDTQIIGYINEGLGILTHPLRLEGTTNPPIALNTSANAYNLPSDCLEDGVRMAVYNTPSAMGPLPVKPISLDEYNNILMNPPVAPSSPVQSYKYTVWGGQILLAPYPGTNQDTLTLFYYKTAPNLVSATDIPAIPERFHIALVYFALARCQEAQEESQLQQMAMQQFQIYAQQMRNELSRTSRNRNRVRRK